MFGKKQNNKNIEKINIIEEASSTTPENIETQPTRAELKQQKLQAKLVRQNAKKQARLEKLKLKAEEKAKALKNKKKREKALQKQKEIERLQAEALAEAQLKAPRIVEKKEKKKKNKKLPASKTCTRFDPNFRDGLTQDQVDTRIREGLTNKTVNKNNKTIGGIILKNTFTFFNILNFIVAGALIAVHAYTNVLFMVIVTCNLLIGIIQEIKAKITVDKINLVTSPTARVIRDGQESSIAVDSIVLDDVILFATGNQICADCVVLNGAVEVNESLLTGESVPVKKNKGDVLLSGSFVVSGKCVARVDKVGAESYTSELSAKAKTFKKQQSELLRSMRLIITIIGIIIIPLAIVMYYNNYTTTQSTVDAVKQTAGSIIGMIPAGMFLLTSVALAVGVIKLASKRTLVQDLYSIEMLARTDVLCLDKTGTITDGTMKVVNSVLINKAYASSLNAIIGSMLTALDDNNMTSRALATYFGYSKEFMAKTILPFNSTRKISGATFKNGDTYLMGAPEYLLKGTKNKQINDMVKDYAEKGLRVLLVCQCNHEIVDDKVPVDRNPIAVIVIEDHIRDDAQKTIEWFKNNGVKIKIISGDNPITVSEVSRRVGVENAEKFVSLEGMNEQQVIDCANKYTVFGRVSPEQKCILVKALKSKGHKVAMTGDGVNDILALKEADCSIAMASGSEATRHVSNLVLLDSNFSSMPSVVAEGRRVVNNVQNSASLFLMKTIFTILTSILCLITKEVYPFTTLHMCLLETFVIGIPSFFLALQPNDDQIKGRFLTNLMSKSLPGAILFLINLVACYVFARLVPSVPDYTIMASLAITFTGLLVLFRLCQPFNVYRAIMFVGMLLLTSATLYFVPLSFFYGEFAPDYLSLEQVLFIIVLVQASYPIYAWVTRICDRLISTKRED